jgi:putative hydrolases of HD superfamily
MNTVKQNKLAAILAFLRKSKNLQSVERYSHTLSGQRNNVAEHSWRLALMTFVIGTELEVPIDIGHALKLALIHDLAEAETGDIDAYLQIQGGQKILDQKAAAEQSAMEDITSGSDFGKEVFGLWEEYEKGESVEAKFVRALDKIEGYLHIAEDGVRAYAPAEFHADYANKAVAAFDEAAAEYSQLKDLLDVIKADLRAQFEKTGVTWIEE